MLDARMGLGLVGLLVAVALPVSAQEETTNSVEIIVELRGRDGGEPIAGVFVELIDVDGAGMSDQFGRAQLSAPPGTYLIRTSHVAYHDVATALVVPADSVQISVSYDLSFRAIPLPPILVEAQPVVERLEHRSNFHAQVTAFDYEAIQALVTTDVAKTLSYRVGRPLRSCGPGDVVQTCWLGKRGEPVEVCVFVDDQQIVGGMEVFQAFPISEIARVEIFEADGQIRVYTRDFFRRVTNPSNIMPVTRCL